MGTNLVFTPLIATNLKRDIQLHMSYDSELVSQPLVQGMAGEEGQLQELAATKAFSSPPGPKQMDLEWNAVSSH